MMKHHQNTPFPELDGIIMCRYMYINLLPWLHVCHSKSMMLSTTCMYRCTCTCTCYTCTCTSTVVAHNNPLKGLLPNMEVGPLADVHMHVHVLLLGHLSVYRGIRDSIDWLRLRLHRNVFAMKITSVFLPFSWRLHEWRQTQNGH